MCNMSKNQEGSFLPNAVRSFVWTAILASMAFTAQTSAAAEKNSAVGDGDGPNYAAGFTAGGFGLGVSFSSKDNWLFETHDQIQWRVALSGIAVDDIDNEADINHTDYDDVDVSLFTLKAGADWYPHQARWADEVFYSMGLTYVNSEFGGAADTGKTFQVGGQTVNPGDITSMETDIEYSGVSPYFSVGWGNRLTGKRGFDFQAEIGLVYQTSDVDVQITTVDPNNLLSAANVATEKKEIEDDIDDVQGFASVTVSYLF